MDLFESFAAKCSKIRVCNFSFSLFNFLLRSDHLMWDFHLSISTPLMWQFYVFFYRIRTWNWNAIQNKGIKDRKSKKTDGNCTILLNWILKLHSLCSRHGIKFQNSLNVISGTLHWIDSNGIEHAFQPSKQLIFNEGNVPKTQFFRFFFFK